MPFVPFVSKFVPFILSLPFVLFVSTSFLLFTNYGKILVGHQVNQCLNG